MTEPAEPAPELLPWGAPPTPRSDAGITTGSSPGPPGGSPAGTDPLALLRDRRSRPMLIAPAPGPDQLDEILRAACSARVAEKGCQSGATPGLVAAQFRRP